MDVVDQLHAMRTGALSRRAFHRSLLGLGVAVAAVPVLPRRARAAGEDQATYFTWGGYDIPDLFGPYIAQNGVAPNFTTFGGSEEALTKMRAGFVVDVSHPCNQAVPRWIASGLFQPLDTSRLSNWPDVMPELVNLPGNVVDGKPYMAPMEWGQTSITYRTDLFGLEGEESWGMMWDKRHEGRLAALASGADTWWCGAIYAGVPFDEIDTDAAFEKIAAVMREQRPLIRVYTDDTTSLEQSLASGEVVAAITWNESAVSLKGEGVPVKFAKVKEGALTWVCGPVIHKDAPNLDRAYEVVDSLLSVETGRFLIGDYGYGHSNRKAFEAFWIRSRAISELAMLVAEERVTVCNIFPDQAFLAGVFIECGVPVLMQRFSTYCKDMRLEEPGRWADLAEEDRRFNADHCVVGYLMARHWKLPDFICDAIRYHHDLSHLDNHTARTMVAILHLAMHLYHLNLHLPNPEWETVETEVLDELGLREDTLPELIDIVLEQHHAASGH